VLPFILGAALLGTYSSASADVDDSEATRESLRGIHKLFVSVALSEAAEKLGLSKESLQTDIQLKLRQNGITVMEGEGGKLADGTLAVTITVPSSAQGGSLFLSIDQPVRLARDSSTLIPATTWEVGGAFSSPGSKFIRDTVGELLNRFLNAWLPVNPPTR